MPKQEEPELLVTVPAQVNLPRMKGSQGLYHVTN
jgi:hypothetical protein